MKRANAILFLLAVTMLAGCRQQVPTAADPISKTNSIKQEVLFEVSYVNHAWGYQHRGIYIDSTGAVYAWQYGPADKRNDHDGDIYTLADLMEKYQPSKRLVTTIPQGELMSQFQKVATAASGPYSDTTSVGADMGAQRYVAFTVNDASGSYRAIGLALWGDWTWENRSAEAKSLKEWLDGYWQQAWQ